MECELNFSEPLDELSKNNPARFGEGPAAVHALLWHFSPRSGSHPPTNWQSAVRRALISAFHSESWRKRPGRQLQISDAARCDMLYRKMSGAYRTRLPAPSGRVFTHTGKADRGSTPVYLKSNPILCDNWSRTGPDFDSSVLLHCFALQIFSC